MNNDIRCPDCAAEMEKGFVLDHSFNVIYQTYWHKGEPDKRTFLGKAGGIKPKKELLMPITCYKCNKCGLLKHYAV